VSVPALAVGAASLLPVVYLVARAWGGDIVGIATNGRTLALLGRTTVLAVAVTAACLLLGVTFAFLTTRTDLPGRRVWTILLALPLVVPTFVGAYTLIAAVAPGGLFETWFAARGVTLPSPYGFGGAFLTLTLYSYPYVLLTVQAALRGSDPALEEASRTLGVGTWPTLRRVTLPQVRPAAAAGSLLVVLYVLSDFGAVSLLRYSTFTRAIYLQYRAAFDRTPAAILGLMLVVFTIVVLVVEMRVGRDRGGQFQGRGAAPGRRHTTVALGRWRLPAFVACSVVALAALAVPMTVIGTWLARGIEAGEDFSFVFRAARHSLWASLLGAVASVAAAMPVALWATRHPGRWSRATERAAFTGYALPGIVVALSLVFFGIRFGGPLYQTTAMLVFAYVVLFLPQAIGAIRASLLQVPANVEEAARTLGSRPLTAVLRVVVPLARRGAVAGGALVFLTTMKELPATLLLAPIGFDTLATRVWSSTNEAFFARAAAPALALILLGSVPLAVVSFRSGAASRTLGSQDRDRVR
jgi:iron(III) transport system permease protein